MGLSTQNTEQINVLPIREESASRSIPTPSHQNILTVEFCPDSEGDIISELNKINLLSLGVVTKEGGTGDIIYVRINETGNIQDLEPKMDFYRSQFKAMDLEILDTD